MEEYSKLFKKINVNAKIQGCLVHISSQLIERRGLMFITHDSYSERPSSILEAGYAD